MNLAKPNVTGSSLLLNNNGFVRPYAPFGTGLQLPIKTRTEAEGMATGTESSKESSTLTEEEKAEAKGDATSNCIDADATLTLQSKDGNQLDLTVTELAKLVQQRCARKTSGPWFV